MDMDPMCMRCMTDTEMAKHALRDCTWARDVWAADYFFGHHVANIGSPNEGKVRGGVMMFVITLWYL